MSAEDDERPGLAAERTALAWQRSGLSLAATGAVLARGIPGSGASDQPAVGAVVVILGVTAWLVTALIERRRRLEAVRPVAVVTEVAVLAATTALVGLALLVVAAWPT